MSLLDLLEKIPGVQDALTKVDTIKAQFLAIPAQTQASKAVIAFARSKTNDATEMAALNRLQQQALSVDSGFQSVVAQFGSFDDLRRSGASPAQIGTAAVALISSANAVRSQSDTLSRNVAPVAAKYGQPAPQVGGGGIGGGVVLLALAGGVMLYVLGRQKRGRR